MANEFESNDNAYDPEQEAMEAENLEFLESLSDKQLDEVKAFRNAMSVLIRFSPNPEGLFLVTVNGKRSAESQKICNFKSFSKWVGMNVECIVEVRKGYVEMINGALRVEVESL